MTLEPGRTGGHDQCRGALFVYILDVLEVIDRLFGKVFHGDDASGGQLHRQITVHAFHCQKVVGGFALINSTVSAVMVLVVMLSGVLGVLDQVAEHLALHRYLSGGLYILAVAASFSVLGIPGALYSQFVIEERFGFNRTTLGLFLLDRLRTGAISLVISAVVLTVLFAFMERAGGFWWLYAAGFIISFQFVLMVLYPTMIAPLFNRFVPVKEGEVRSRLARLSERLGYRLLGIFVMDGSKRSRHSNAYFTGLGPLKRIVLFDTLLDQLDAFVLEPAQILERLVHGPRGVGVDADRYRRDLTDRADDQAFIRRPQLDLQDGIVGRLLRLAPHLIR